MLFNALTSLIQGCMGKGRPSVAVLPITSDTHKSRTCTAEQWKFVTCYCTILNLLEIEFKLCSVQQQLKDSSWIISSRGHHLSERTASLMHIKHYQCENKSQSYIYYTCDQYYTRIHFVNAKLLSWKLWVLFLQQVILVLGRDNPNSILMMLHYPYCFWLVMPWGKVSSTNQKHY